MSKHTPGPWDWEPPMPHQDFCEVEHKCNAPGAASRIVARVTCRTAWFGEQQANARLIAAAPELLEACANARDMLATDRQAFVDCHQVRGLRTEEPIAHGLVLVEEGVWITPEDAEALRDYDKAITLIDAAIAKATGEQP